MELFILNSWLAYQSGPDVSVEWQSERDVYMIIISELDAGNTISLSYTAVYTNAIRQQLRQSFTN